MRRPCRDSNAGPPLTGLLLLGTSSNTGRAIYNYTTCVVLITAHRHSTQFNACEFTLTKSARISFGPSGPPLPTAPEALEDAACSRAARKASGLPSRTLLADAR